MITTRLGAIDAVRVLGCLAIVAGHVWTREATAPLLYTWHVPVFFFLSGCFWSRDRTLLLELRKRWNSLGKPYVTWVVILTLAVAALVVVGAAGPERIIGGLWGGSAAVQPYTTIWFVSALFFTVILYRAISKTPLSVQWGIAAVGVACGVAIGPELAATPLAIGSALPCLIFLVAGRALNHRPFRHQWFAAASILGVCAILIVLGVSQPMDVKFGDYGTPVLSTLVAIGISYALVTLATDLYSLLPGLSAPTTAIALTGLVIVLLHPVMLYMPGPDWARMAVAFGVPCVIGLLALRAPFSQWVTGQARVERVADRSIRTSV